MRLCGLIAGMMTILAGCTGSHDGGQSGRFDAREIRTITEPGLHITGYANVGVVRDL